MGWQSVSTGAATPDNVVQTFDPDAVSAGTAAPSPDDIQYGKFDPDKGGWMPVRGAQTASTPVQRGWSDVMSSMGRGAQASALGLWGAVTGDQDTMDRAAVAKQEEELYQQRAAEQGGIPGSLSDVDSAGGLAKYVAAMGLEAAPTMGGYAAAGTFGGLPGLAAMYAANVAAETGSNVASRVAAGQAPNLGESALYAMPTAALNAAGPGSLLEGGVAKAAAGMVGDKLIPKVLAGAGAEAAEQGAVGAGQYALSTAGAGQTPTWAGAAEAAGGGALMGAGFGGWHGAMVKAKDGTPVQPVPDQTEGHFDLMGDAAQKTGTAQPAGGGQTYGPEMYKQTAQERKAASGADIGPQQPGAAPGAPPGDIYARDAANRAARFAAGPEQPELALRGGEAPPMSPWQERPPAYPFPRSADYPMQQMALDLGGQHGATNLMDQAAPHPQGALPLEGGANETPAQAQARIEAVGERARAQARMSGMSPAEAAATAQRAMQIEAMRSEHIQPPPPPAAPPWGGWPRAADQPAARQGQLPFHIQPDVPAAQRELALQGGWGAPPNRQEFEPGPYPFPRGTDQRGQQGALDFNAPAAPAAVPPAQGELPLRGGATETPAARQARILAAGERARVRARQQGATPEAANAARVRAMAMEDARGAPPPPEAPPPWQGFPRGENQPGAGQGRLDLEPRGEQHPLPLEGGGGPPRNEWAPRPAEEGRPPFELGQQIMQGELPLEHAAEPAAKAAGQGELGLQHYPINDPSVDWRQVMRDAWRDTPGRSGKKGLQGYEAAVSKIIGTKGEVGAKDAAEAAAMIRDKMNDAGDSHVPKLDAMHQALTGETIDQYDVRTTGEQYATEARNEPEGSRAEHQGNGEGGPPAEAGGGGGHEQGGQGEARREGPGSTEGPSESRGATESERAAEGAAAREGRAAEAETAREGTSGGEGGGGGGAAEPRPNAANERGRGAELGTANGEAGAQRTGSTAEPGRLHVDPKEQARLKMPEFFAGKENSLADLKSIIDRGSRETPDRRLQAIAELEVIRQLHRDPEYVAGAEKILAEGTSMRERQAVQPEVEERAAEINNSDLASDQQGQGDIFRRGTATTGAHDQEVHDAAAGNGTNARALLDHIAKNHPDPEVRQLAAQIRDKVGEDVTVRHATDAERAAAPPNALASYKDGEILLHSADGAGQSVVHEAVHDATARALDAGGRNAVELRSLFAEAQKHASLMGEYGIENVKEFVAEARSNPGFRDKLAAIAGPKGNMLKRLWNAVKRLLGMDPKSSLLDHVMESSGKLMDEEHPAFSHGDGGREALYRQASSGTATGASNAFSDFGGAIMHDVANIREGKGREGLKTVYIGSMPTNTIVKAYDHLFKGALRKLADVMDKRTDYIGELGRRAQNVYKRLEGARKAEGNLDRFHDVISSTQISGLHPKEYDAAKAQEMLRKAQEAINRTKGMDPTSNEFLRAQKSMRQAQAAVHARDQWEKMTPAGKDALDYLFNNLKESHHLRRDVLKQALGKDAPFLSETQGPYAPLKRYGDWIVSTKSQAFRNAEQSLLDARKSGNADAVREAQERLQLMRQDPAHRTVMGAENALEAKRMVADLKSKLPGDTEIHQFTRDDVYNKDTGHRDAMVTDMLNELREKFGGTEHMKDIEKAVLDSYMDHLPDGSSAALAAHREMVSGWNKDFSRAALDRLQRDAFQLGSIKYGLQLHDALAQANDMRKSDGSVEANKAYTEMAARMSYDMNYNNFTRFENMIHGATHTFYLGASPGFMLMNMMQTPMISVPVMSGRHGWGGSIRAAMEGMKQIHDLMRSRGGLDMALNALPEPDMHGRISPEAARKAGLSENQILMLRQLQNMGLVDLTTAHLAARVARGERNLSPEGAGGKVMAGWQKAKDIIGMPTQYVEVLNRAGTGLGAYNLESARLSKKGGMSPEQIHEAATKYAIDVIRDSHVDYSAEANSNLFRMPYMRVVMQFKKFGLTMFHMLNQRMVDTFGHRAEIGELNAMGDGRTPEQQQRLEDLLQRRSEGRRTLTGIMAMHQLFAGSMGLPFAGAGFAAADLIRGWTGDKEEKYDTKADFQNYLADAFGVNVGTAIARGLPAALLGIDMSRRAGMADIMPFSNQIGQAIDSVSGGNPNLAEKLLVGFIGPAGGVGEQVVKGFQKFAAGDYAEGAATMMPRAVFNAYQGAKMMSEGIQVGGKSVHEPLNGSDALLGFLGLSTEVSRTKDAAYASKEAESVFSQERMRLVKAAAQARAEGEPAPDEVAAFNSRNPQGRITMGDIYKYQQTQKGGPKRPTGGGKGAEMRAIGKEAGRFGDEAANP